MTEPVKADSSNSERSGDGPSLFAELKKRRVYQSAAAYAVVAWGITEILDGVVAGLGWPDWLATLAVILFVTGFPVAMFLAWVYDWTPDGIRRTASSGPLGWLPALLAVVFLVAGSAGLFWLINPSGVARVERVGVAVLPCRYRGDPDYSFRGEGIAEILNSRLAYANDLFVPSFDAMLRASATPAETRTLAQQLRVSSLIDCRVMEDDGQVRLIVSLVDIESDESRELSETNLKSLELLDALRAVERDVRLGLGLGAAERPEYGRFASSLDGLDQYVRGLQALRTGTAASLHEARDHFRAAQDAGPFTLAKIGEAEAMLALFESEPPPENLRRAALAAVALILDEIQQNEAVPAELFAARLRHANLLDRLGVENPVDDAQRLQWFQEATIRRPSFVAPYLQYANCLEHAGRLDEARELRSEAEQLAPTR
jgi:TolB-like protein